MDGSSTQWSSVSRSRRRSSSRATVWQREDPGRWSQSTGGQTSRQRSRRLGSALSTLAGNNWPNFAKVIMERACMEKFKANDGLRKYLFKTKGSHLVYCNPEDLFWGIGLRKSNQKRHDSTYWLGPNHLGDILVRVRDTLLKDPKY